MNVWLDDKRPMPAGYSCHVTVALDAIKLIRCGFVDMISLDHDLGDEATCGNGYMVAQEIESLAQAGKLRSLTVYVHTQNPVGRQNIMAALSKAAQYSSKCRIG